MISKSQEEYLKNIYILKRQNGNIRVTDIANKMNCTKPSVNKAINNLKENGLINYESYGTIELTENRRKFSKKDNRNLWYCVFVFERCAEFKWRWGSERGREAKACNKRWYHKQACKICTQGFRP